MNKVFSNEIVIFNVVVIVSFILISSYLVKKNKKELEQSKKRYSKIDRNEIVDILVDSLRQPTLLLSRDNKVLSYNHGFSELIIEVDINEYVKKSDYIQRFLRGGHNHRRFEEKIGDRSFYIDLDIIDSKRIKGTIITYTDITILKEMYQSQENFIKDVKHEIKTPLTAIIGLSELLIKNRVEDIESQKKILTTIHNETHRLDGLVTTLTSTIESKAMFSITNMDDIFDELKLIYQNKSSHIKITFSNYFNHDFINDKEIIKQIMINLIDNAYKYTNEGYIKVSCYKEESYLKLAVVDTGVGIGKEDIEHIFERFYRVDKSRNRNTGGFGLGLSIVKSLLEKISGEIEIESSLDKGTTITVILLLNK